jgi:hypothetical protein
MGKAGRPKLVIDWAIVDELCASQATQEDIAAHIDVSVRTLKRAVKREHKLDFAEFYDKKRRKGFVSLRRAQFKNALSGNSTMQIWLGKQYLGQKDKPEVSSEDGCALQPPSLTVHFIDTLLDKNRERSAPVRELTNGERT